MKATSTALNPWRTPKNPGAVLDYLVFNSATALKPWRTFSAGVAFAITAAVFNSATALKPWRTRLPSHQKAQMFSSSIRPRRGSRGEQFGPLSYPCDRFELQFGHGVEAVENTTPLPILVTFHLAALLRR